MNKTNLSEKHFIKRPEYPGGKDALTKYIQENLRYPADALEHRIEGNVKVWYEVNDNGIVVDSKIIQSLSPSCDKEALRLVNSFQYGSPKNMHLRVRSAFTITIRFRLKEVAQKLTIQYSEAKKAKTTSPNASTETYTYTINF